MSDWDQHHDALTDAAIPVAETHVTGNLGVAQATHDFLQLGWGPVPNGTEDAGVGIDLFVFGRDEHRRDLGHWVTAQVKGGDSYFDEPERKDGQVHGWFFRDTDDKLLNYWLSQPLVHLIVLCNTASRVSYWVHVTEDRVRRTGKGWKILVPADQVIDEASRGELERVASTSAAGALGLEGSVWSTPQHMSNETHGAAQ